ncbi:ferrochelatase [Tahibacter amnicola]|uniref:Ferrochelatase n=1 Tax=Tahibacter amnicola TaxID=2976241 RepID=A0ABY6BJP4_9GAMM|nr:ferrochelatase [Tahibacter amnicola]UXI68605.1 ferrochelatase [Tahibacter amnicola]
MPRFTYSGRPEAELSRAGKAAVVLINLGTPDAPTPAAVRRYLAQFLSDPRVIEAPRWLWLPVLYGAILPLRSGRSARAYTSIWTEHGSPLLAGSQRLAAALDRELKACCTGPVEVHLAMTYGQPSLPATLAQLDRDGVRRILALPLYPQYSATSTGAALDALAHALGSLRWPPELRTITDYHDNPDHIEALARTIETHWASHGRADRLVLSFHGIPLRYAKAGDPYRLHCQATARRLAERLGLPDGDYVMTYQSRVGREEWLKPYTDVTLAELAAAGVRAVQVVCPGFAVDCLETLEEIAVENRQHFLHAGGQRYEYIPALNDQPVQVESLLKLVLQHTRGWPEFAARTAVDAEALHGAA